MGSRHRDGGVLERLDDAVFALDLVGRLQQGTRRFLAHHQARARSLQQEGWIRLTGYELRNDQWAAKSGQMLGEMTLQTTLVEPMVLSDRRGQSFNWHAIAPLPGPQKSARRLCRQSNVVVLPLQVQTQLHRNGAGVGARWHA